MYSSSSSSSLTMRTGRMVLLVLGLLAFSPAGYFMGAHAHHLPDTLSPAPTETMVPSPSPSEVPTTSPAPSASLSPSAPPTSYPTTSMPTLSPTEAPTESPAPSPSPSESPTESPSSSPTQSQQPTLSLAPSTTPSEPPTDVPSTVPSDAPSSIPSDAPTFSPTITRSPTATPTVSPQPSSSPTIAPTAAPTIAPSSRPTVSHAPTSSNQPSMSPSSAPTPAPTGTPSSTPSSIPTSSLMPSAAPSEHPTTSFPSLSPSQSPSNTPTGSPTTSMAPSQAPTISPQPTMSHPPSSAPSFHPTAGERVVLIEDVQIIFEDVMGEMDMTDIGYFEAQCVDFLNANFPLPSGIISMEIEAVTITDQTFVNATTASSSDTGVRRMTTTVDTLRVTFRVLVTVFPGDSHGLDTFMNEFFEDATTVQDFRKILNQFSIYFEQISLGGSKGRRSGSKTEGGFPGAAYGAVAGVLMSITGSAVVLAWFRKRKEFNVTTKEEYEEPDFNKYGGRFVSDSMPSTVENHSSLESKSGAFGEFSGSSSSIETATGALTDTVYGSGTIGEGIYPLQSIETSLVVEPGTRSYRHQNPFNPTLIQFEANIEVPVTPAPGSTPGAKYDMTRFDPEDPAIGAFSGGNQTDMELKRIFQAWNAEVDGSEASTLPYAQSTGREDRNAPTSEPVAQRGSKYNVDSRMPDTSISARGSMEEGIETVTVVSSDGTEVFVPVNDAFDTRDDDDEASLQHVRKKRLSGGLGISKFFGRSRSNGSRNQDRRTNGGKSPSDGSVIDNSIPEDDETEITPRLGAAPSPRDLEFALMDELGYQWSEKRQHGVKMPPGGVHQPSARTRTPQPLQQPGEHRELMTHDQTKIQLGHGHMAHRKSGGTRVSEFMSQEQSKQSVGHLRPPSTSYVPRDEPNSRAGTRPPTSVGARWSNRSGYYMSDSSESTGY